MEGYSITEPVNPYQIVLATSKTKNAVRLQQNTKNRMAGGSLLQISSIDSI
jgi:hypothetical protein